MAGPDITRIFLPLGAFHAPIHPETNRTCGRRVRLAREVRADTKEMDMKSRLILAAMATFMAWTAALRSALAENVPPRPCAERAKVIQRLAERYGETLQSLGLQENSTLLEVYASDATGTWTILITRPNGMACLVASGQSWEKEAVPFLPKGDDA